MNGSNFTPWIPKEFESIIELHEIPEYAFRSRVAMTWFFEGFEDGYKKGIRQLWDLSLVRAIAYGYGLRIGKRKRAEQVSP